jgi:hypothetical protein
VPNGSDNPKVLVETTDLFFRAKLDGLARAAGWASTRSLPADLAVIELGRPDAVERVRALVGAGVPVVAFGSHVATAALRAARDAGATAVPNSQVEPTLRTRLDEISPRR